MSYTVYTVYAAADDFQVGAPVQTKFTKDPPGTKTLCGEAQFWRLNYDAQRLSCACQLKGQYNGNI